MVPKEYIPNKHNPKVSILMSVYNGEQFLQDSIGSILDQTFGNFEFLIINDASTDNSRNVILSYKDPRIRLIDNNSNLGLTKSLNKGIELSCGEYIARMDCDDISLPTRLEKQVNFMDDHENILICGTWGETFGLKKEIWKLPTVHEEIKVHLYFNNVFIHSSVMLRKNLLNEYKLKYNPEFRYTQDYELWTRCAKVGRLANLPEVLVRYRVSNQQIGCRHKNQQTDLADSIRICELKNLGADFSDEDYQLHKRISLYTVDCSREFVRRSEKWLLYIRKLLSDKTSNNIVADIIFEKWFFICNTSIMLGPWVWWKCISSKIKGSKLLRSVIKSLLLSLRGMFKQWMG